MLTKTIHTEGTEDTFKENTRAFPEKEKEQNFV